MLSIRSSADMARALDSPLDHELRRLLTCRRDQLREYEEYDLGELAHLLVIDSGDTLASVEAETGLAQPFPFETVERHPGGWIEAVIILSDDGYGVVLFVPDRGDPDLLRLLLAHA